MRTITTSAGSVDFAPEKVTAFAPSGALIGTASLTAASADQVVAALQLIVNTLLGENSHSYAELDCPHGRIEVTLAGEPEEASVSIYADPDAYNPEREVASWTGSDWNQDLEAGTATLAAIELALGISAIAVEKHLHASSPLLVEGQREIDLRF
jgi:hypothetical protein